MVDDGGVTNPDTPRHDGAPPGYYPGGGPGYPPPPYYPGAAYPQAGAYVPPPPTSPAGVPLADFGVRLVAKLLDGLFLGVVDAIVLVPMVIAFAATVLPRFTWPSSGSNYSDAANQQVSANVFAIFAAFFGLFLLAYAVLLGLRYVYEVEMMWRGGQTLGKRIMKIRVVPLDPGQPFTRGLAAKRFLAELGCSLVAVLGLLDGLWQLWDKPYLQCLHDKWPQTCVIRTPSA
jgi:uncharacterized RDD family membrane protein YckC